MDCNQGGMYRCLGAFATRRRNISSSAERGSVDSNSERNRSPGGGEAVRGAVSLGVCLIKCLTLRRL